MKRNQLQPKDVESGDDYRIVEVRVIAVWNDGLVEDWTQDLATDSTLSMELGAYCTDYEDLRNQDPEEYNASDWS